MSGQNNRLLNAMGRPFRILSYILDGSFTERWRARRRASLRQRRQAYWDSYASHQSFVEWKMQPGVQIRLYPESELAYLIMVRDFERPERAFTNAFLRPGDVYIDIGANIGVFSLIAARKVGAKGKVYAVEPSLTTFKKLEENIQLNRFGNIAASRLAISDSEGEMPLNVSLDGFDGRNSLTQPTAGEEFSTEMINTISLDAFVDQHQIRGRIALIKIDVEGWEMPVLKGGRKTLSATDAPVLQVEFTEEASRSAGFSCAEIFDTLIDYGYQIFQRAPGKNTLISVPYSETFDKHFNAIAVKDVDFVLGRLKSSWWRNLFRL